MTNKKNFYQNLVLFIASLILLVLGVLLIILSQNNRLMALGGASICFGLILLLLFIARVVSMYSINKLYRQELLKNKILEKKINASFNAFKQTTNYPEKNTIRLINSGIEFFANGRYVCKQDFKNIAGYHFAFEINSTKLKYVPEDYNDICGIEDNGVLIAVGYHDGEPLEKYANDNGVVLQHSIEKLVNEIITLKENSGYNFYIWTAEGDEISYGFVKILDNKKDTLTIYFLLNVPFGLNDTVEGTIELKKDNCKFNNNINNLIKKIKQRPYNIIRLSNEDVKKIKNDNPFLQDSYVTFLKEIGLADLNWIDIGRNENNSTNLNDYEVNYIKDILKDHKDKNLNDYYFIGVDNADTYYALSRNKEDKKVYIFSNDATQIDTYENFEEFLYEILKV